MQKRSEGKFVVIVGRLAPVVRRVVADDAAPAAALPTDIEVLPFPRWETDAGTFVTDAESQRLCVEAFNSKRRKLVWDYEHQTLQDVQAPAAAWTPIGGLIAGGERGLRAKVEWTDRGGTYVAAKEYDYYSPVAIIEKSSKRVIAIHSIALTNTPKTQDQTPLSEQIAAKALIEYEQLITAKGEGGTLMNELIERLMYFLNMATTSTFNQVRAEVQKILDVLPSTDEMVIAPDTAATATAAKEGAEATPPTAKTIMDLIGLVVAKAKEAGATIVVASKEFLAELDLPEAATLAQVQAKVAELKFPANMVDVAEHEQVVAKVTALEAELAEIKTAGTKDALEQLIAANKAKLPPAKDKWFRELVAKHGLEHGREVLKNLDEVKPRVVAKDTAPLAPVVPIAAKGTTSDVRLAGKDIPVDEESLVIRAKVEAIQREDPEKFGDYAKATDELHRREKLAK